MHERTYVLRVTCQAPFMTAFPEHAGDLAGGIIEGLSDDWFAINDLEDPFDYMITQIEDDANPRRLVV